MIYKIRARIIEDKLGEFFAKLTDGTIKNQKPEGKEIFSSMKRAVITDTGYKEI